MEPLLYIPNNIKQVSYGDYTFHSEITSALSFWKLYGKCTRKSDNKTFSTVIIPDKKYMESCLEFLDQIFLFEIKSFLPCIGYINELDTSKEMTWYHQILIFEEFKCTLAQYTNETDLTRQEFESLIELLIEATRFLTRDIGGVFPRFTPDCIIVQKPKNGKAKFRLLDMFFIKGIPNMLPFEDTKWVAPEIYELYPSIISMTNSIKKDPLDEKEDYSKSFLFSAGLVLLYTNSKSNFQEKRKNAKSIEDLNKIWPQEAAILDLGITKIKVRYNYTKEDYAMQILRGVIDHTKYMRIDLETIRAFGMNGPMMSHGGDQDISVDDFQGYNSNPKLEPQTLKQSNHTSNTTTNPGPSKSEEPVLPAVRKAEGGDDPYLFKADSFVLIEKKPLLSIYGEKSNPKTMYSVLRHPISDVVQAKSDPYVKQLLSIEKIDCQGMMKLAGYFYEDEIKKDMLMIMFEPHTQSLTELLAKTTLDKEGLANMVKSLIEALHTLQTQKAISPPFLTPHHIFIASNKTMQMKFKFLLSTDNSLIEEFKVWISPELFMGETIKDKPQSSIYSFALVILYAVLKTVPTSYRSELQDKTLFKSKEIESIKTALVEFRKKLQIEVNNPNADTFEGKLNTLIAQSLEINPFHRTDVISWNLEQASFTIKNPKDNKNNSGNIKANSGNIKQKPLENPSQQEPEAIKPKPKKSFFCCSSSKSKKMKETRV